MLIDDDVLKNLKSRFYTTVVFEGLYKSFFIFLYSIFFKKNIIRSYPYIKLKIAASLNFLNAQCMCNHEFNLIIE